MFSAIKRQIQTERDGGTGNKPWDSGVVGAEREEVPSNFCLYATFLSFLIVAD